MTTEPTQSQVSYDSDLMVTSPLFSTQPSVTTQSQNKVFHYLVQTADMQLGNNKHILLEGRREVGCSQKNRVKFREN